MNSLPRVTQAWTNVQHVGTCCLQVLCHPCCLLTDCAQLWCRKKYKYLLPPICHLLFHRGVVYPCLVYLWIPSYKIGGIELWSHAGWYKWTLAQIHALKSNLRTGVLPGKMCLLPLSTSIIRLNIYLKEETSRGTQASERASCIKQATSELNLQWNHSDQQEVRTCVGKHCTGCSFRSFLGWGLISAKWERHQVLTSCLQAILWWIKCNKRLMFRKLSFIPYMQFS